MLGYGENVNYGEGCYKGDSCTKPADRIPFLIEQFRKPYINSGFTEISFNEVVKPSPFRYISSQETNLQTIGLIEQYKKVYING